MLLLFLGGTSGSFKFQVQNRGYMHAVSRHACQALRKASSMDRTSVEWTTCMLIAEWYGDRESHFAASAERGDRYHTIFHIP